MAAWVAVAILLAALTSSRIRLVESLGDQGHFAKYTHFAELINAGELPVHRLGDLSPGYLWTMAGLSGPMGLGLAEVRALQIAVVSVIALLVGFTAWRLRGTLAAAVAMLAVIGSRAALINATEAEPETLVLLLNTAGLCLALLARTWRSRLAAGLFFGLSAITRPTVLPAVALIALWLWWRAYREDEASRSSVLRSVPAAFIAAAAAPVLLLNLSYASIPGGRTLMNPGTVFYEGANPTTTGLAGDAPSVVKEVEPSFGEPDALHLAYRRVAGSSLDRPEASAAANAYWWSRARGFITTYPSTWLALEARKLWLAFSSHEAWDLATMERKNRELHGRLWVPFSLLGALALLAVATVGRHGEICGLCLYSAAYTAVILAFYVTSRQRLALLPALAILAGLVAAHGLQLWREGRRRHVLGGAVLAAGVAAVLSAPTATALEDLHGWTLAFESQEAQRRARTAASQGNEAEAQLWSARAALRRDEPVPPGLATAVRTEIARRLSRDAVPAERFDLALAAARVQSWVLAERILETIEDMGYAPRRGAATTSSIAYHRARCRIRLGDLADANALLAKARDQAPGDAAVLALSAVVADAMDDAGAAAEHRRIMSALHDRFTWGLGYARALADAGSLDEAHSLLHELSEDLPEWTRPQALATSAEMVPRHGAPSP